MSNNPIENEDYMDDGEQMVKPFALYESLVPHRIMSFYLSTSIGEPHHYIDMIHRIKTAGPNDTIYIYLNTPGGNIATGVQMINAMEATPATIVTVLEAEAHSLGTLLFLSGDEFIINDNCRMMFHNFSSGLYGKGNELEQHLESTVSWFGKLVEQIYLPFLSVEELDRMRKGEDLWFDSDEIRSRLERIAKEFMEAEKELDEIEKSLASKKKAKKKAKPKKKKSTK